MTLLFDRSSLMDRIGQDEEVFHELIDAFFELQPGRVAELRDAIASGDSARTAKLAHLLCGGFRSLSMDPVGQLASAIEQAARHGDRAGCGDLMVEFDNAFSDLLTDLAPMRGANP